MAIGTGWLGWTEQQTDDTLIPVIILAYEERARMLRMVFGIATGTPDKPPAEVMPAEDVLGAFRMMTGGDPARKRRG